MNLSEMYAENCSLPRDDCMYYLKKYGHLLKWKNHRENILDVGCGEGSVTREILFPLVENHVGHIEAIDRLEHMIEFAKSSNGKQGINFKTMDINNTEYVKSNENKFDHIFSFYCIHWIVDVRSLFSGFYRMLKPGGQIFVTTFQSTPTHRSFKKILETDDIWSKYIKKECFANYSGNPEEYITRSLENVGFEVELCKHEKRRANVNNFKDFTRSLIYMSNYFHYLPVELREKFIEDNIRLVCEDNVYLGYPDKYDTYYESIVFIATKKE